MQEVYNDYNVTNSYIFVFIFSFYSHNESSVHSLKCLKQKMYFRFFTESVKPNLSVQNNLDRLIYTSGK